MRKLLFALFLILPGLAAAQTVIGTAVVDGREIEILSNNTWRFATPNPSAAGCTLVRDPVSFCGDPTRFQLLPVATSPVVTAQYQVDDRTYAMIIVEGLGRADGINLRSFRESVLLNAAAAFGNTPADIPILDTYEITVEGERHEGIAFSGSVSGLSITYYVTLVLQDRNAIQLITYVIGSGALPPQRVFHDEFVSLI
ncbi:MAG: hypothetical protein AAF914_16300, partial [Pseudomonadota bacterium]